MAACYHQFVWILCLILALFNPVKSEIINATLIQEAGFLEVDDDGEFIGYIPDLLKLVAGYSGHTFSMKLVSDGFYGTLGPSGWTGMMGELLNGDADIAGPLTMAATRSQFVDFSYPIISMRLAIVMKRPPEEKPTLKESLTKLLIPMEFPVWLMTVLAFLVTSTVLYIISHFNPYEWRRMAKDKEATLREAESFTCLNSFWFVISTLAWQGYVRAPRSTGGRIAVTAWWFFVLIFILTYTASLTNFLRVGPDVNEVVSYAKIQSMNDLASDDDMDVGYLASGSTDHFYKNSARELDHQIYEKAAKFNISIRSNTEGLKLVRERENFALIMESATAKYVVNRRPCNLYMVTDDTINKHLAFAFRNDSPFAKDINIALLKLQEKGQLAVLDTRWFKSVCKKNVLETSEKDYYVFPTFYQMDLGTFSGAILILAVGIVAGGLVSIVEFCIYKWAEAHPDEEEKDNRASRNTLDSDANHQLLDQQKRGGATQV